MKKKNVIKHTIKNSVYTNKKNFTGCVQLLSYCLQQNKKTGGLFENSKKFKN